MRALADIALEDKYRLDCKRALISGRQALVRLVLAQREADRLRGLNTAGLISGYRGSPLGGLDLELWHARAELQAQNIHFQPGVNEDLALTALAGAQQLAFVPKPKVDGVFGLWYGKGPGVDRSGDAIKHANLRGVSAHGGLVLAFGDDHVGMSSTTAHQSDITLASWGVPILYPSSVAEIVDFGLAGFALSRYAGLLVGLKLVNETADATAVVTFSPPAEFILPRFPQPKGGVNIRPEPLAIQEQDARLVRYKLPAAAAFADSNQLDRIVFGSESPRFLIATSGKPLADVLAALQLLGIDLRAARSLGIAVFKIGLLFPLNPRSLAAATREVEEILFVEEKRPHAESQAKDILYNQVRRPRISGKTAPSGEVLLPADAALDAHTVASALARRLRASVPNLVDVLPAFEAAELRVATWLKRGSCATPAVIRRPAFCPGCPHNSSTKVPKDAFGATGIGCHGLVVFHRDRNPLPMGHMGGEGAQWIGMAPFTETGHIFQNLGDGTYSHSGSLAIRAAVQSGANITFKILFNDAVAMTGGQPIEGALTVGRIVQQVFAEGVSRVDVVSENPTRFAGDPLPPGAKLHHRDKLAQIQAELRNYPGVSVLIYDQVCAAEKRRRRRVGAYPDPVRRVFINSAVCEGCGDCSSESNCLAIQPLETELGRKRRIDQSACNADFSCAKGFCPAFVSVANARPRSSLAARRSDQHIPEPPVPAIGNGFDLLIAGVGGSGVLTVSAILGMAACTEGIGASLCDMTGLSQKGGQVFSHVRLRRDPRELVAARIGAGEADVLLACDLITATQAPALSCIARGKTAVVGNSDVAATAEFQVQPDLVIPEPLLAARLQEASGAAPALLAASQLSKAVLGDTIGANVLLLGFVWQKGLIPLRRESIEQAIELNGRAVRANLEAFSAGRRAALTEAQTPAPRRARSLDEFVAARTGDLRAYWNVRYAECYAALVSSARLAADGLQGGERFVWAVARYAYEVMAYKDEYEVARLYTDGQFQALLSQEFQGPVRPTLHLAPPLLSRLDPATGRPRKLTFGPWIFPVLRALAALKFLREGPLDVFAGSADRRLERDLRDVYLQTMRQTVAALRVDTLDSAISLAEMPRQVRGFGYVKEPAARAVLACLREALSGGQRARTGDDKQYNAA
jgi:indolepyruvate ferredoxin oxidoreductase